MSNSKGQSRQSYRVLRGILRFCFHLHWEGREVALSLLLLLRHGRSIVHHALSVHCRCRPLYTARIGVSCHHTSDLGVHARLLLLGLLLHVGVVLVLGSHVARVHPLVHHRPLSVIWVHSPRLKLGLTLQGIIPTVVEKFVCWKRHQCYSK